MRLLTCVIVSWTLLGYIGFSCCSDNKVYQGCFSVLTLQRQKGHLIHPFVPEECVELCFGDGHHYVGLDSINSICYCGKEIMTQISKVEDTLCKPCKDESFLFCGGVRKLSVYKFELNTVSNNLTNEHQEIESNFEEEPVIILAGHGGIYLHNTSTHELRTVVNVDYHIDAIGYHLRRKEGFAVWDEAIFRFPLFEERPLQESQAEHMGVVRRCSTFAVDWVHDKLYWPDCYSHQILFRDLHSELFVEESIIKLADEGAWAMDMVVDPYKGLLFWTSGATLWSCRLDGRGLTKVVPKFPVNRVSSLSLDLTAERVYFSGLDKHDNTSSKLYFSSYNGSISHSLQFHEYEGGSHVLSFGILNHYIYFIKQIDSNSSLVMTSKLEYNHRPSVLLQGKDIQVKLLRLVHPLLQAPGKVDICTNYGCSHMCVVEASLPRCHCSQYFKLEHDNKTCTISPGEGEEEPLLLMIAFWLMLVLLVLLGAGVLMCLCDKLWSQLHPTVQLCFLGLCVVLLLLQDAYLEGCSQRAFPWRDAVVHRFRCLRRDFLNLHHPAVRYDSTLSFLEGHRYLFLLSNNSVFRRDLEGASLTILHLELNGTRRLKCLALDTWNERVYYSFKKGDNERGMSYIGSCDYEGGSCEDHPLVMIWSDIFDIFALDVFRDTLYFADYSPAAADTLYRVHQKKVSLWPRRLQTPDITYGGIWSIRVYHPGVQQDPKRENCQIKLKKFY